MIWFIVREYHINVHGSVDFGAPWFDTVPKLSVNAPDGLEKENA